MTDTSGCGFEAEPLKGGEAEEGVSKEKSCAGKLGLSHLTGWRTAIFLLSLFLCLAVVFAFSFILPCPVRPKYESTWNSTIGGAVTYDFLAVEDVSKDKVLDIFFMYKGSEASRNTCMSEYLSPPCLVLMAVDGTDGKTLWTRPLAPEFHWVECGVKGTGCLVAHANNLTAINKCNGSIIWQQPLSTVMNANLPLISVPDLNADGAEDFALLSYNPKTELLFFSGKSGEQIGSTVDIDANGVFAHQQFYTAGEAPYLLLLTDSGLYAVSLQRLAVRAKAGWESKLKKDKSWEKKANPQTGCIALYQSDSLKGVLVLHGKPASSLLIQAGSSVSLLHTDNLQIAWTTNSSNLLSVPTFGQFDKDGIVDIMMEEDLGNETKRVMVLSGRTGEVLWEINILSRTPNPHPASVLTLNSFSVFMLWGNSYSDQSMYSSFLLHPLHSHVLLERKNTAQNIVSFKATLLERGRHACYLVLTGPDGRLHTDPSGMESVVLTKRKIKDDVSESEVLSVVPDEPVSQDTEDSVKEGFYRLRFSEALY
ncbi:protein FAM234A [Misgurnus anguillicaudatus]|uniref:protein FAM234A n=1 Tax=Misgurnus anguillicaudatus TaxID=75329 RepID=UPI003CCF312F